MRRGRVIRVAAATLMSGLPVALLACGGSSDPDQPVAAVTSYPSRTVDAGEVTVELQPRRLDADRAEFDITFDTHSVELDLDVANNARLTVDGTEWAGASWSGDGPGGHHRSGTLRFTGGGPPTGTAVLELRGLEAPIAARWTVGGG